MHKLSDLKAAEVTLRNSLETEKHPTFRADIAYALKMARIRRVMAERAIGIQSVKRRKK